MSKTVCIDPLVLFVFELFETGSHCAILSVRILWVCACIVFVCACEWVCVPLSGIGIGNYLGAMEPTSSPLQHLRAYTHKYARMIHKLAVPQCSSLAAEAWQWKLGCCFAHKHTRMHMYIYCIYTHKHRQTDTNAWAQSRHDRLQNKNAAERKWNRGKPWRQQRRAGPIFAFLLLIRNMRGWWKRDGRTEGIVLLTVSSDALLVTAHSFFLPDHFDKRGSGRWKESHFHMRPTLYRKCHHSKKDKKSRWVWGRSSIT